MIKFTRRQFIQSSALGALYAVLPPMATATEASAKLPNIIFIIADDLGYRDLGCYGSKTILTPNIDKMCTEGIKFTEEKHGFDTFFGYYNQVHAHDYYTSHLFRNSERVELNGRYSHYAIYDETIKFIKESAGSGKPFFCYCPWTPPHANYVIPEDDPAWAPYKDKP